MMARSLQLIIIFVDAFLMLSTSANSCATSVFVFGDSQFDAGNNRFIKNCTTQANFPPYGSTFFHHPTGRFTDGRTVADFIAQYLGTEFQKPYQEVYQELENGSRDDFPVNGINFASGGSGVLPHTNKDGGVTPIQVQLQQFQSLIDQNHIQETHIENSLYFLESGSNDIFNYFVLPATPNLTAEAYVQAMLKEVDNFIDTIYKLGGRKIVVFSVGPMGCVPARVLLQGASVNECFDKMNNMSQCYNTGLELLVNNISRRYSGAVGVYGEIYNIVQKIRENPKSHGFDNVNEACCGGGTLNGMLQCGLDGYKMCSNPNEFFFWDYIHPSERTYGLLSNDLWDGGKDQIRPINLKTLACNTSSNPLL